MSLFEMRMIIETALPWWAPIAISVVGGLVFLIVYQIREYL